MDSRQSRLLGPVVGAVQTVLSLIRPARSKAPYRLACSPAGQPAAVGLPISHAKLSTRVISLISTSKLARLSDTTFASLTVAHSSSGHQSIDMPTF